jgi:PAS domain S-box-containing protein
MVRNRPIIAIGGLTLVMLAGGVISSFATVREFNLLIEEAQTIASAVDQADSCLSDLRDAETGTRGYVLTGDAAFLRPFNAVITDLEMKCRRAASAAALSATPAALTGLDELVEKRMAEMAVVIQMRKDGDITGATARVAGATGMHLMEQIRQKVTGYISSQQTAVVAKQAKSKTVMQDFILLMVALSCLGLALGALIVWLIYRDASHRLADQQHAETNRVLGLERRANEDLSGANDALQLREEQLEVTLNSIGDAVIATDVNGIVVRINVTAERLTAWPAADAVGQHVDEVFRIVSKATRLPAVVPVRETLLHGTIMGLANHTVLIGRDGCEHDIGDSCAPIRDRHNDVIGAVLVFRDVTAEYQLQQTLTDTLAKVQAVLATAADGIVTFRARDGAIETVNAAALSMFGYANTEIIGASFSQLIPELADNLNSGRLDHYAANAAGLLSGLGREVTGQRKDGTVFPVEIAASEVITSGDRLFTAMLRDNTVRKRVEAERTAFDAAIQAKNVELQAVTRAAETANLAKSDFLSSMSHELRTPLGAILGFAQLLESSTPPPSPTQSRSIGQILKAGWYLLDLINEILDLAQIESGRISLSIEPTALGKLLSECEAMVEPQAARRGITLMLPKPATNLLVKSDWTRLKQVMVNLLSNAIKYNRPQGTVTVQVSVVDRPRETAKMPQVVRISITDSGLGLSPEQLKHLFQPFNRLGQESSPVEGTGIGLVVCKRLVEQMGGTIGVISNVDIGSTFWVEVPQADAQTPASRRTIPTTGNETNAVIPGQLTGQPPPDESSTQYTMLYVEDNPANLLLVEELIARRPEIQLLTAVDGDSGIAIARSERPALILMDINLPGTSGLQAMKILAMDASTAHIRVLALSANALPRDIERGLQAGFYRYLTKPIKVHELLAAIDEALEIPNPKTTTKPVGTNEVST